MLNDTIRSKAANVLKQNIKSATPVAPVAPEVPVTPEAPATPSTTN